MQNPTHPSQVGPYVIHEKIGAGGMGSVYLGRHSSTGQIAAVKVLPASLAQEGGFVERFAREIESMKRLNNPYIVKLYDDGVDGGTYYYAMEYVAGETLTQLLRREKRLPWQRVIEMSIQICQALKSAHDTGIIHRDLKPSNLLVTPDGTVKLTDFGVAQVFATDRLTVTGGIVGTAEFMSPEQAEGKRATKQSDLYSLGAVMYALVTGRPPFSGTTAVDVLQKHRFGRFDPPRLIVPEIPYWFDEIICQLLEKDPAKRFPDAFVLARRLQQVTKKVELAEGATIAEGVSFDPSEATVVTGVGDGGGPGPATVMQNLVRAELDEMQRPSPLGELFNSTWLQVALLVLLIAGGFWWFHESELTPDEKYAAGMALLEQPEGADWIRARDEFFAPLLQEDPRKWGEKLAEPMRQIGRYELERRTESRRLGRTPAPESEPERLLTLAKAYHASGDLVRAERTLTALTALLEGDADRAALYDHSQSLLESWRKAQAEVEDRYGWVQNALDRAAKLSAEGERDAARRIWSSIVELYAEDPGADSYVQQARQALSQEIATGT